MISIIVVEKYCTYAINGGLDTGHKLAGVSIYHQQ